MTAEKVSPDAMHTVRFTKQCYRTMSAMLIMQTAAPAQSGCKKHVFSDTVSDSVGYSEVTYLFSARCIPGPCLLLC